MLRTATFFKRAVVVGLIAVLAPTVASLWAQPVQSERATPKLQAIVPGEPTAAQAGAGLLHQPPNQKNGIFSDLDCDFCGMGPIQILAENFTIGQDPLIGNQEIGLVRIHGGYFPDNKPPTDAFTVVFHADNDGVPGRIINMQMGVSTHTLTGVVIFGVDEYAVDIQIFPVSLTSGTYWVSVYNNTAGSTDSWFWGTGLLDPDNGLPGIASRFSVPTPGEWFFDKTIDLAITLFPPDPCPWDLDGSGSVGAADLLDLLFNWGPCPGCPADFDGDDIVGASDLLAMLFNWGPCP